jgi:hypothetical protein
MRYQVSVNILEARSLAGKGALPSCSDPICYVRVGDQEQHSRVVVASTDPVWNSLMVFDMRYEHEPTDSCVVEVRLTGGHARADRGRGRSRQDLLAPSLWHDSASHLVGTGLVMHGVATPRVPDTCYLSIPCSTAGSVAVKL